MIKAHANILAAIGNTPLVRLNKLPAGSASIYLKLEQMSAGGSVKDRIAQGMIEDAEASGRLRPGMTIIESSSGNTAIGLAMIAAVKGYRMVAICDRFLPGGKRWKLRSYGADIVFLPATAEGLDTVELRIQIASELAAKVPNAITLLQYDNLANRDTHYRTTGQEIWRDTEGAVDACVMAVGTCGTVSGVGRALKEKNPKVRIVGVEPVGSIIFGGDPGTYLVQGGGLSFIPRNLDREVIDEAMKVRDEDTFTAARRLALEEGIMVGGTGGAVTFAAKQVAERLGPGACVVGVIPDSGDRYLDTMYSDDWLSGHAMPVPPHSPPPGLDAAVREIGCSVNEFSAGERAAP